MKKLTEFVKTEFKKSVKIFFRPFKSRWFWPATIVVATALFLYSEHELAKDNYKLLPEQESKILQQYDPGIKGIYTLHDMRKLLIDYDLIARENPREIPELLLGYRFINEPNNYAERVNKQANILK